MDTKEHGLTCKARSWKIIDPQLTGTSNLQWACSKDAEEGVGSTYADTALNMRHSAQSATQEPTSQHIPHRWSPTKMACKHAARNRPGFQGMRSSGDTARVLTWHEMHCKYLDQAPLTKCCEHEGKGPKSKATAMLKAAHALRGTGS